MIKRFSPLAAALALLAAPAARAQAFDYYLLALTWTPSWCLAEGDADAEQCGRGLGFTLHGLWPQFEAGWPEYCDTDAADPSRRQTGAMADIMGSGGLAWYEWKKHGRCTGLSAEAYFAVARRAYAGVSLPAPAEARTTAAALEARFLAANPALAAEDVIVTCREARVAEVRICLTPDLAPRACAPDVLRDACRGGAPLDLPPVR